MNRRNLVEDATDLTLNGTGNTTGVDPNLGPLVENGGPTKTHALLSGSPAIDAGDPDGCKDPWASLDVDQRGEIRPYDGDGDGTAVCDIGAYEAVPSTQSFPWERFPCQNALQ